MPEAELSSAPEIASTGVYSPEWARQDAGLSLAFRSTHAALIRFAALRTAVAYKPAGLRKPETVAVLAREVRGELSKLVRLLRTRQEQPERVLVILKELLAAMRCADHEVRFEIEREVITWAIEDYYADRGP